MTLPPRDLRILETESVRLDNVRGIVLVRIDTELNTSYGVPLYPIQNYVLSKEQSITSKPLTLENPGDSLASLVIDRRLLPAHELSP